MLNLSSQSKHHYCTGNPIMHRSGRDASFVSMTFKLANGEGFAGEFGGFLAVQLFEQAGYFVG